jgi:hypothetical protein
MQRVPEYVCRRRPDCIEVTDYSYEWVILFGKSVTTVRERLRTVQITIVYVMRERQTCGVEAVRLLMSARYQRDFWRWYMQIMWGEAMKNERQRLTGAAIAEYEAEAREVLSIEHESNTNPTEAEMALQELRMKHPVMKKKSDRPMTVAESGRLGGLKGGVARAANMSPEQRSAACSLAAKARWAKTKPKTKAKRTKAVAKTANQKG